MKDDRTPKSTGCPGAKGDLVAMAGRVLALREGQTRATRPLRGKSNLTPSEAAEVAGGKRETGTRHNGF